MPSEEKVATGRPQKEIDWKLVDNALQAHCSGPEIAAYIGIHYNTFYRRVQEEHGVSFTEYSEEKKAKGKSLLKMTQFDEAIRKRDRGMLIWLGKQLLDQRDNKDIQVGSNGQPVFQIMHYGTQQNPSPYKKEEELLPIKSS